MATQKQLEAARAEVKAIRAAKAAKTRAANKALKAQAAAHVNTVQPDAAHVNVEQLFGGELPNWKRVTVGFVLGLLASGAVGYGIGLIMAYALAGIATLTGSAALAFTLSAIVWVLGIYAAWKIGGWIGGKVFASVVLPEGLAAKSYESLANGVGSARARVAGWLEAKPLVVQA